MKKIIILALSSLMLISCSKNKESVKIIYHSDYDIEYIITIKNTDKKSNFELYKRSLQILINKMKEDKSYLELYKMVPSLIDFANKVDSLDIEKLNFAFVRNNCNIDPLFKFEVKNNNSALSCKFVRYLD